METIKTDIKRAIYSLPFITSCLSMVLTIAVGIGGKQLFPEEAARGLTPFYHANIIFQALQSDIVLMVVPIICAIPYTAAFLDEYKSGFIKPYLMKTHMENYIKGKVLAAGLSCGLVLTFGISIAYFLAYLVYSPMEIAAPEMVSPILQLIQKAMVFFLCGALWASVGAMLANVSMSKYMAYASPFVIYYVLVILAERYFRSVYVINPKEWLSQYNNWPGGDWGVMLLVLLLTVPVMLVNAMVIKRKIES